MTFGTLPGRNRGSATTIILTILVLAMLAVGALVARQAAPERKGMEDPDAAAEKTVAAIAPVARLAIAAAPAAVSSGPKTGEEVVTAVCGACHTTGASGAPKIGDNAAWAPRIAQGFDVLMQAALKGKNAMPAKGGNPNLSDLEIARAVVFMTGKSGGHFPEPKE